jgi:hypothetical protein
MKRSVIVICVLAVIGCKSAPPVHVVDAGTATLPAGWASTSSRDGKISIGVPGGWRQGADKMTDGLLGMMPTSDNSTTDPGMAQLQADVQKTADADEQKALAVLEQKGILIHVINGSKPIPGEARTHYSVSVKHLDHNAAWPEAIELERKEFAFPPHPDEVNLPVGKALKFSAKQEQRDGGVIQRVSYAVINGQTIYSLRFITEESPETILSIAEPVARTWRIKGP